MKQFLLLTFVLLLSSLAIGQEEQAKKMYKLRYLVEQNDTLAKIYKRFVYPNSIITKQTPMTQRTFKGNPEVKDWNKLEPGSMIDLYIQYEYLDMSKYQAYIDGMKQNLKKAAALNETENSGPGFLPEGLKASIFYMASYGKFTQKDPSTAEVEFYQNSPITLGLSTSYYPKQSLWSFQASAYASYLLASANNLDDKNVKVDPELGLTFYPEYRFVKQNFTGYFGIDYERFSTFNMGGIQQDRTILLDSNTVLYGTVGFSKLVHVFKTPFFTKLSFSHSITSKNDPNSKGIKNTEDYTGYKILWYVNKKFTERLYLHTLFKYHVMDGPSELKALRLGIGFGYILF